MLATPRRLSVPCNINSSTRTANVGLNKIQFRAALCVGAGSIMLESVFSQVAELERFNLLWLIELDAEFRITDIDR